jgi:hypothetical protein
MAASLERTTIASSLVFVFSFDGFDSLFIDLWIYRYGDLLYGIFLLIPNFILI